MPLRLSLFRVLFIVALLLSIASEGGEPANPERTEPQSQKAELQQNKPDEQQLPRATSTLDKFPGSSIGGGSTKPQTPQQKGDTPPPTGDATWYFNLLITIFTGALVFVGIAQLRVYKAQAQYMREGLEETRKAANAATKAAEAAESAIHAERPNLMISDQGLTNFHAPPLTDHPKVRCTLTNGGKGPAIIKTARATAILSNDLPKVGDFSACADMKVKSVIAAGESIGRVLQDDILAQYSLENLYNRIISSNQPLIFFGEIVWEDVFRGRYRRTFLYRFNAHQDLTYWSADLKSSAESVGEFIEGPKEYNTYTEPSEPNPRSP